MAENVLAGPPAPRAAGLAALGVLGLLVVAGSALSFGAFSPMHTAIQSEAYPALAWRWDGAALVPLRTSGAGPAADRLEAAFDPALGGIVVRAAGCRRLVLGFTGGCTLAASGAWLLDEAGAWRPLPGGAPAGFAPSRSALPAAPDVELAGSAAVYDPVRGAVVVIGSPRLTT